MAKRFKVVINGIELDIVRDSDGKFLIPDDLRGLGSALKPAHEPICVARKPFKGTVANNVIANRTGALNVDACRVPSNGDKLGGGNNSATVDRTGKHEGWQRPWMKDADAATVAAERSKESTARSELLGRWPANIIHDGSDEVIAAFPDSRGAKAPVRGTESSLPKGKGTSIKLGMTRRLSSINHVDNGGSAARFFYCAKASKKDRDEGLESFEEKKCGMMEDDNYAIKTGSGNLRDTKRRNIHPTVKPAELMRYLVRLVTPPNGIVLDPFMGSGSTGKAAMLEGFKFAGIDMTPEYVEISRARIKDAKIKSEAETEQEPKRNLFASK